MRDAAIHTFKEWIATQNKKRFARDDDDGCYERYETWKKTMK